MNGIKTLISICYKVSTTYFSKHSEFEYLKQSFVSNGYRSGLFNCQIKTSLHNTHVPSPINDYVKNVKEYRVSISYFGSQSTKLLLTKYFKKIKFQNCTSQLLSCR